MTKPKPCCNHAAALTAAMVVVGQWLARNGDRPSVGLSERERLKAELHKVLNDYGHGGASER